MTTVVVEASSKPTRTLRSKKNGRAKNEPIHDPRPRIGVGKSPKPEVPKSQARITKQEQVLTLLSRPDGANVEEIMQATSWQQHSVRGFLAGTVKKKLGFTLTSSKETDEARRYRIASRRSR